jgi:hypothetical protein
MPRNTQDEESQDKKPGESRRETLARVLNEMEKRLSTGDMKISVADFMRLVQFERELAEEERPREIKVTWSEPLETYENDE